MASLNTIPFDLPGFQIDQVDECDGLLTIAAHSATKAAKCPACQTSSRSIHSHYVRSPRDGPCSGREVQLVLTVRRFRCINAGCEQKIFVERIPKIVPVYGHRTELMTSSLRSLVYELSAEAASRVAQRLRMRTSGDTLLRIIRQTSLGDMATPRVLGVDDWAFKKGQRYGTVLVDLEKRQPVDLLPDRTTETLAQWLQAHPGIEIITRDRGNEYIMGISEGAPQAVQIADRWHLLCNQSEALQRLMQTHTQDLRLVAKELQQLLYSATPESSSSIPDPESVVPTGKELRYQEVHALAARGYSLRSIARQLHMSRKTVRRYLDSQEPPARQQRQRPASMINPYLPYLAGRWEEGCRNARILWEEIRDRGFPGSYSTVRLFVRAYRRAPMPMERPTVRTLSPRQATWLLLLKTEDIEPEQRLYRDLLLQRCPDLAAARILAHQFLAIIRERQADQLDPWVTAVLESSVPQLKTFAEGLLRDYAAVKAALTFDWSNGQTEGQVNRLKVLKRVMYGRANFDLLRLRVLVPT